MEKVIVHMEIALAVSKAQISIATAGVGLRFTLHMSAVAVPAFNRDVQFALWPNRFRFSGMPFSIQLSRLLPLEVSDKVANKLPESCGRAFTRFSRKEIMIIYSSRIKDNFGTRFRYLYFDKLWKT